MRPPTVMFDKNSSSKSKRYGYTEWCTVSLYWPRRTTVGGYWSAFPPVWLVSWYWIKVRYHNWGTKYIPGLGNSLCWAWSSQGLSKDLSTGKAGTLLLLLSIQSVSFGVTQSVHTRVLE
jgi:hypothetical protein